MVDYTITIGNLVSLAGIIMGGIVFLIRVEGKLNILIHEKHMEQEATVRKFTEIDGHLSKLADAIVQIAKQEVRMDGFDSRMHELLDKIKVIDDIGSRYTRDSNATKRRAIK